MTATCETALSSGQSCGVIAIGRCGECERAYCGSHRATNAGPRVGVEYINLCSACRHVPGEQQRQREVERAAAAERKKLDEAGQLALAEEELRKVLVALRAAGLPGAETQYRRTYPPKHYFTSATKLKRVEIGKGWHVGELKFLWTAPSTGDYNTTERIERHAAMVLAPSGDVVHAEPDDIYRADESREKFIRTAEQIRLVIERLSVHLRRDRSAP